MRCVSLGGEAHEGHRLIQWSPRAQDGNPGITTCKKEIITHIGEGRMRLSSPMKVVFMFGIILCGILSMADSPVPAARRLVETAHMQPDVSLRYTVFRQSHPAYYTDLSKYRVAEGKWQAWMIAHLPKKAGLDAAHEYCLQLAVVCEAIE